MPARQREALYDRRFQAERRISKTGREMLATVVDRR
jgi:hypothetical protein